MNWKKPTQNIERVKEFQALPSYAFQFVLRNLGPFRPGFIAISGVRVLSSLTSFLTFYLLSSLISELSLYTTADLLQFYLPVLLVIQLIKELLDYYIRRYGEVLPTVYGDHIQHRFLLTFYSLPSHQLFNISKERLSALTAKYVAHIRRFVTDWTSSIVGHFTTLVIICAVLFYQSPYILLFNLVYMGIFLRIALGLSNGFAPLSRQTSLTSLNAESFFNGALISLNFFKRARLQKFLLDKLRTIYGEGWLAIERSAAFHARRWFIQRTLFNCIYVLTLCYGAYQVQTGILPLGYLLLIKWAFDSLTAILIYILEYYVKLFQQREDIKLIRAELAPLMSDIDQSCYADTCEQYSNFSEIQLTNISITFVRDDSENYSLRIPSFEFKKGERVGITGPSGSGKSTLFGVLMGHLPYCGEYNLNNQVINSSQAAQIAFAYLSGLDPLLKLSIRDNLLLGRTVDEGTLQAVLKGTCVADFISDLDVVVGSPNFNLSAGQEQRIRLARTLLMDRDVLLLDEPFNGIDNETKIKILSFLRTFLTGKTVLLSTHIEDELSFVERICEISAGELKHSARAEPFPQLTLSNI